MNKLAQFSAITIAASAGLATAGSLDLDRSYATELRSDAGAYSVLNAQPTNLEITAGARFGYFANFRDSGGLGDDDTTIGFGFQDMEVRLTGQVTDSVKATVSFDFGATEFDVPGASDGVRLEDAYADWTINDGFTLRTGQFVQSFSHGRSVHEFHMMGSFRSTAQTLLGSTGWSQGIEAHFGGDTWSAAVGFTDGPFSANSAFDSDVEADYAFNGRFDLFSDADKERFNDRTSWRGSAAGWRVGAGAYWASYGDTNPSGTEDEVLGYTIDGSYEADGWGVHAAFFGQHVDPDGGDSQDNFGFELGANMFFNDQFEGYARYDIVVFDDDFVADEDTFQAVAVGLNYYLVPESHAAKITAEVTYAFEDVEGAPLDGSFGGGFLGDTDGEFGLNVMFQFLF